MTKALPEELNQPMGVMPLDRSTSGEDAGASPRLPQRRSLDRYHWVIVGAAMVHLGCVLVLVAGPPMGLPTWEVAVLNQIHHWATPELDQLALRVTGWGTRWGTLPLFAIGGLALAGQRQWRKLAYWLGAIGGTVVVAALLKLLWHRSRPDLWPSVLPPDRYPTDWAFPSGHAAASLSLVAALWVLNGQAQNPDRWRWAIALLGGGFVLLIAWTRLYLGVHAVTDILGGWSLALLGAIGLAAWFPPIANISPDPNTDPHRHHKDSAG